ncbi:TPA: hypothetical protein QEN11_22665 [Stenotrophomonas maltophilia]|nr:hypothetical protein [Stenotrophomonas maltophilia]HEP1209643.1 hypothetical protein [Stenotrophomonas maltophilia]
MNDVDNACSCPSGDGSLRHPCSAHPAPADVQPGGRVRLGDQAERARFEAWVKNHISNLARAADGEYASNFTHALWSAWQAALSAHPSPGGQEVPRCARHCQNGFADICLASQRDGVICPEDSCDIDDRMRHNHLAARQPVNGLSWADYWTERGQPDAAHDFDAFSRAEAWALQRFPDARQPVGEPEPYIVGNQYFTRAGDLVRFVAVHNEGSSYECMEDEAGVNRYTRRDFGRVTGSAHDYSDPRNTPPLYAAPPAQAVDMTAAQAVAVYDAVTRRNFTRDVKTDEDKARTVMAALTDNQAVGQ